MPDNSPVIVKYNNVPVFDNLTGNQPIPFISRSQQPIRYGAHWGQLSTFSIDGQITGSGPELWDLKNNIIDGFKQDFKEFSVEEGGSKYVSITGIVRNINFSESQYYGILDYSISIEGYEDSLFAGTYGVLNPVDQISYTHTEDEKIEITHEISAKGFQTGLQANGSSALGNAKDFVFARRDSWKTKAKPLFASGEADFSEVEPILVNSSETIDRFEGIYSLTDTFVFSRTGLDRVIENRSVSIESGIANEVVTATLDGEIYAGKSGSLGIARTHFEKINHYDAVRQQCPEGLNLYHIPINLDIKEDPKTNTLNYSVTYDNINIFLDGSLSGTSAGAKGAYFDYNVSVERDALTDIVNTTINGTVKGRGNAKHIRKNIQKFYDNTMGAGSGLSAYLYHQMGPVYSGIMGSDARVPNPFPSSLSVSSGNANGEIQVSAQFSDEDYVHGFLSADYSVSVNTAMPIKTVNPSARFEENGYYMLGDMDAGTREQVDISVNMVYDRAYYATNVVAENEADGLYTNNEKLGSILVGLGSTYTPLTSSNGTLVDSNDSHKVRLLDESYNENRDSRSIAASYSYSFNGSNFPDTSSWDETFMKAARGETWISDKYFNVRTKSSDATRNG